MHIFDITCSVIISLGAIVASLYFIRAARFVQATIAYLSGDMKRGDELYARADRFARWLP